MKIPSIPLPLSVCLLSLAMSVNASPIEFRSTETQVSLLELYTSEGCSSCPPAEGWFSELKESGQLWHDFVPVAFHVDYWDHLGWHDPWSSKAFSDRQRAYAESWHSDSIYTPGLILNGKEWRAWSRSKSIPASTVKSGILKVLSNDLKSWEVTFSPGSPPERSYEAHAALLASGLISDVKSGENRGRRLQHDFAILELKTISLVPNSGIFKGSFSLAPKTQPVSYSLAIWITKPHQLEPLQATGGWVSSKL